MDSRTERTHVQCLTAVCKERKRVCGDAEIHGVFYFVVLFYFSLVLLIKESVELSLQLFTLGKVELIFSRKELIRVVLQGILHQ